MLAHGDVRESVRRELFRLFNTRCAAPIAEVAGSERTVIDFGVPDFTTLNPTSERDRQQMARLLVEAVRAFEPRLQQPRVEVRMRAGTAGVLDIQPRGGAAARRAARAGLVPVCDGMDRQRRPRHRPRGRGAGRGGVVVCPSQNWSGRSARTPPRQRARRGPRVVAATISCATVRCDYNRNGPDGPLETWKSARRFCATTCTSSPTCAGWDASSRVSTPRSPHGSSCPTASAAIRTSSA